MSIDLRYSVAKERRTTEDDDDGDITGVGEYRTGGVAPSNETPVEAEREAV